MIDKLDKFHKTKAGYSIFAIIELAISYGFMSLAINSGNIWWYLVTLIFFVGCLQNLVKLLFGRNKAKLATNNQRRTSQR